jgi:tetratricopeptide (TPR) repeat protein
MGHNEKRQFEDLKVPGNQDPRELSPAVYCLASRQFRKYGRLDEALSLLQQGVRVFPESVGLYYEMGIVLKMAGEKKRALESLEKAIRLFSKDMDVLTSIASLYKAQGDQIRAVTAYKVFLAFEQLLKVMDGNDSSIQKAASTVMTGAADESTDKRLTEQMRYRRAALYKMERLLEKLRAKKSA